MQLQQNLSQLEDAGVAVFAISHDTAELQAAFASEYDITFPLLVDVGSQVIKAVGILNTLIEPEEEIYGVPFPGSYVVGTDGLIEEKYFFQNYRTRRSSDSLLRGAFGIDFEVRGHPTVDVAGEGVAISATVASEELVFEEEAGLFVDLRLDPGLHLYGRPIPDGYVATEVWVEERDGLVVGAPRYPSTKTFRVDGLDEEFQVFSDARISIELPLRNVSRDLDPIELRVHVRYQACSDTECFIPQNRVLELTLPRAELNRPPDPK